MKLPAHTANPILAVLLEHSGYGSLDEFATAINAVGAGPGFQLKLRYDHMAVKRWLSGRRCQHPEVVAKTLTIAWGVEIPPAAIFPQHREGCAPVPPHLWPAAAERTLDELAIFIGSDMLARRHILAAAIKTAGGAALTGPLLRWLRVPAQGLSPSPASARSELTIATVEEFEKATAVFSAQDASVGGGQSREAAVGQLKYGVDLLRDASYPETVGNRMLLAVASLANLVGWMSHDVGMDGPAQRYFMLGLQAARESRDPHAPLTQASILGNIARQLHALEDPRAALDCIDAAIAGLPRGQNQADAATLWNLRARMLASLGPGCVPEIEYAIYIAEDLLAGGGSHGALSPYAGRAELAGNAALAWQIAAEHRPGLAKRAANSAQFALDHRPAGFTRSRAFDQISLSAAHFAMEEADQGADDGDLALDLAEAVPQSSRVHARLRKLMASSAPYASRPKVRDFRDRLSTTLLPTDA